jgi:hypothetical protein
MDGMSRAPRECLHAKPEKVEKPPLEKHEETVGCSWWQNDTCCALDGLAYAFKDESHD